MSKDRLVQITFEEYQEFQRLQLWEEALQEAGVDNWEWYGDAQENYEDKLKDAGLDETE